MNNLSEIEWRRLIQDTNRLVKRAQDAGLIPRTKKPQSVQTPVPNNKKPQEK